MWLVDVVVCREYDDSSRMQRKGDNDDCSTLPFPILGTSPPLLTKGEPACRRQVPEGGGVSNLSYKLKVIK